MVNFFPGYEGRSNDDLVLSEYLNQEHFLLTKLTTQELKFSSEKQSGSEVIGHRLLAALAPEPSLLTVAKVIGSNSEVVKNFDQITARQKF